ncbi:Major Facilitator Superfamily protein [Streptomyces sp. TLI_053]|uniref:MFS transporter n=1 Tax=Streptomyces sp. TLI_053 TaxID=1855352 RepID=UPI00087C208D|nr:MFS transporter [Streptomyces sp. TLI_053]SDT25302.1 Major Facilitator Superfamily protein [Streptomyces sp. TLI_053]
MTTPPAATAAPSSDPPASDPPASGASPGAGASPTSGASPGAGASPTSGASPGSWVSRLLHPDPTVRRLARITLLNTVGSGLSLSVGVLFFTRFLGLSAGRLGIALTAAGLCGVLASVPAGRAADRWGARPVLVALVALTGLGTAGYTLVDGYPAFVALACLVSAADRGSAAVRNALYAEVLPADKRVAGRAYLRVVTNVGLCLGTAVGAIALQVDSRAGYLTAILADAASYLAVAVLFQRLRVRGWSGAGSGAASGDAVGASKAVEEGAPGGGRRNPALRDGPFLVVTALGSVLALQFAMLEVGVPLWIVQQTDAPRITVAGTLIVNTLLVIAFQVPATRGTEHPVAAARACGRAGLVLAASCLVLGLAHGVPAALAAVVVLVGVALQAGGEVLSQAGTWALSYDLADERAHGAYQGVFNAGMSAALMIGPAVVSTAVIGHGLAGWAALGALLAGAGLAMGPAVRWARRRGAVPV